MTLNKGRIYVLTKLSVRPHANTWKTKSSTISIATSFILGAMLYFATEVWSPALN